MKRITFALSSCFLIVTLFASCSKSASTKTTPTGTPTTPVTPPATGTSTTTGTVNGVPVTGGTTPATSPKIKYQLKAANATTGIAMKTTASGSIHWTSASASPVKIKFEAKQGTSEIEYQTTNSGSVDLMSSTAPSFGSFTLPAGTYNEIELKIQLDKGTAPSLQLIGQFSNTSVTIPVTLSVSEFVELKTEQSNVSFTDNSSFSVATTFDLSGLTSGITESMITGGTLTGGTLVISASSNTSLYNIILNNFRNKKHHSEFEKD